MAKKSRRRKKPAPPRKDPAVKRAALAARKASSQKEFVQKYSSRSVAKTMLYIILAVIVVGAILVKAGVIKHVYISPEKEQMLQENREGEHLELLRRYR